MTERQSQFLGILNRAGKIAFGQSAFGKGKKISLLLLSEDASELTQKEARSFAGKFGLKIESVKTKAELGKPFGYERVLKTPSGKVEFTSTLLNNCGRDDHRSLPEFRDWREMAGDRARFPFLLVSGGRSDLVTPQTIAEFLSLVPHAQHAHLPEATHMLAGDDNAAFTATVLHYLDALPPASAGAPSAVTEHVPGASP
jgi:pimeloyl-ACP methyl ester carboxylesterase